MVECEILNKLATRTISYIKEDLGLEIEDSFTIYSVDRLDYLDISTLISLKGAMKGTVGMSVSDKYAFSLVENFIFGEMEQEELEALTVECVSEILNVTIGNILSELDVVKSGGKINISTPYTMTNKISISKKENGSMYICHLKSNDETILLSYFI